MKRAQKEYMEKKRLDQDKSRQGEEEIRRMYEEDGLDGIERVEVDKGAGCSKPKKKKTLFLSHGGVYLQCGLGVG